MEMFNISEDDFRFAVSNTAISAFEAGISVITDVQMENHIHVLAGGPREHCFDFIDAYAYRLSKHCSQTGRVVSLKEFRCDDPIEITDLEMMRNEIAYINRNGFVSNPDYLPTSYPWGSGYLYFNPVGMREEGVRFNDIKFKDKRQLTFRKVAEMPDGYQVKDGMILPASYAEIALGESMFRDAHHYLNAITRNFEAFSEEAKRLKDTVILGREEMYHAVRMISNREYNTAQPSLLPIESKIEIARRMHYDYNASNAQIRSILRLPEDIVDSLFPLKKK